MRLGSKKSFCLPSPALDEPGSFYRSVALNVVSFLLFKSVVFSFVGCLSDEGAHSGAETLQVKHHLFGLKRSFVCPFVNRRLFVSFVKGIMDNIFTGREFEHLSLPALEVKINR